MTLTIQQIVFTDQPAQWHRLAVSLGFTPSGEPSTEWAEFLGDGSLAIHAAYQDHAPGRIDIHALVDDLAATERALLVAGATVERGELDGIGDLLTVRAESGVVVTVSEGEAGRRVGDLAVQPIWFQPDLTEPRIILDALGVRPRSASDRGGWVDGDADGGGRVALHRGDDARTALSFLALGDLDTLVTRLRDDGFDAVVIDEAYGRTIRVPDPDGGAEVWINGVQDDLYGYTAVAED